MKKGEMPRGRRQQGLVLELDGANRRATRDEHYDISGGDVGVTASPASATAN